MKTYKYIYLLCLLALQSVGIIVAQNTMQQPVVLGDKAFSFSYTDTKNTANYTNNFQGRTSNDVFYKFTLVRAMDISIDHCGSGVYDTYLHVLNAAGQPIYSNDDDWEYEYCENPMNSYLYLSNLPAGTYYVVSEGYSQNGNITTTILGISPYSEIGSSMAMPIQLGNKSTSFSFTDTKNTTNYINNYLGQTTNDVFYKFTLTRSMDISISHCGSQLSNTYVHLLDEYGDLISENDDDWDYGYCDNSEQSFLYEYSLPVGTYYVVSEGNNQNGNITTAINGTFPLVENSTNWTNAADIGAKAHSFEFVDTKNTSNYPNDYRGQMSNDVFYKFTLSNAMDVIISHCGSQLNDTYLHLLDVNGNRIAYCDDYYGTDRCTNGYHAYIKRSNLTPGTYYIVSEGYSGNGNITTSIKGIRPLPTTGLYDGSAVTGTTNAGTNYIQSITPTVATSDVSTLGVDESLQTVQYFDGLGRPIQTVQRGIGPGTEKKDLITYTEYDGAGRENIQWLPVPKAGNNGAYVDLATFKTEAANQYGSSEKPYSTIVYESSPLNRVIEQFGAGNDWYSNNKRNRTFYETNDGSVAYFLVDNNGNLKREGNYAETSLYKTISKDEDDKTVEEYKDKLGQVVLKRSKDGGQNVDTYFVNNDLGQLAYVIPPIAADSLPVSGVIIDDHGVLKRYAYLYKYDTRGNCTEKRLPGCEPIYMVYDRADRLVLSQDGNQRAKTEKEWTVTKYDVFGRVLYIGVSQNEASHSQLITELSSLLIIENVVTSGAGFMETGYTCTNYAPISLLTVNYYDNYAFVNLLTDAAKTNLTYAEKSGYDKAYSATPLWGAAEGCKGLLTGTKTYTLGGTINDRSITAMYYDYRGRVVQTRSINHLGGADISYNEYNFSGSVKKMFSEHTINSTNSSATTELYTYTYDHAMRPHTTTYSLNGGVPVILSDMATVGSYDELGRLITKKRHNGTDTESYEYNIRNWTKKIISGTFIEQLFYNNLPYGATVNPCYNGNIAYAVFGSTSSMPLKSYAYTYDNLNRLTSGVGYYFTYSQSTPSGNNETFGFDKMGNIKSLTRYKENSVIDNLIFKYYGNQISSIFDPAGTRASYSVKEYQDKNHIYGAPNEMIYDGNGNMIKDLDRDIYTIRYNILNLPEIVQFKDGHQIINTYDASGQKLSSRYFTIEIRANVPVINTLQPGDVLSLQYNKDIISETGTYYVGNKEYSFNGADPEVYLLNKVFNAEGYTEKFGVYGGPFYQYYRKDHLGNNCEIWNASSNTTIQRTQYYPSGLPWATTTSDHPEAHNKKYNGKEFVEMHGYDTYDIVWRQYYPAIGRFQTVDPEIEEAYDESPYAMCDNNMVNRTDPDGRIWNYVIGAGIGAGIDYASQVALNFVEGKGVKESFTQVDGKSIMVSAVAGATGVGMASLAQKATTIYKLGSASTKVIGTASGVVSDATISAGSQYAKNGTVSAKAVVVDVVAGQAGRGVGNLAKSKVQNSQTGVSYQKQANRAAGKAMYKPNAAKTARAEAATAKSNNYGSKTETAVSSTTSNTISNGNETSKKIKEERR